MPVLAAFHDDVVGWFDYRDALTTLDRHGEGGHAEADAD